MLPIAPTTASRFSRRTVRLSAKDLSRRERCSPDQRFLYVIDGANHHVWILLRDTLEVVDRIGQQGIFGGSLNVPHALAVDIKGNIYVGENFDGRRFQRVVYKGMGAPTGSTLPPPKP